MKLNVHDIEETVKGLAYEEPTEELTPLLTHGEVRDFEFRAPAAVRLKYYRAGHELVFQGHISAEFIGHCARCLEEFPSRTGADFSVVLVPKQPLAAAVEVREDDLDVSFYTGEEVDLSPLVHEQIILALPTRPLCDDLCKGLCPNCGANLNVEACRCVTRSDPRLVVLGNLKVGQ